MTKKQVRQAVYDMFDGHCAYCGCELNGKFHVDHHDPIVRKQKYIKPHWTNGIPMAETDSNTQYVEGRWVSAGCEKPENECINNMMPACASCNIQKNSFTIEQFRQNIQNFVNSLNQYSTQYKFAKRYGLINETHEPVVFYFEGIE